LLFFFSSARDLLSLFLLVTTRSKEREPVRELAAVQVGMSEGSDGDHAAADLREHGAGLGEDGAERCEIDGISGGLIDE
jgi:hypothetical protein